MYANNFKDEHFIYYFCQFNDKNKEKALILLMIFRKTVPFHYDSKILSSSTNPQKARNTY